jgi:hypothetical protein
MYSVRERGSGALHERETVLRLLECDAAARAQINQRIARLIVLGRISPSKDHVDV